MICEHCHHMVRNAYLNIPSPSHGDPPIPTQCLHRSWDSLAKSLKEQCYTCISFRQHFSDDDWMRFEGSLRVGTATVRARVRPWPKEEGFFNQMRRTNRRKSYVYEIFARFNEYNDNDHPDCDNSDCDICGFDDKHSFLKAEFFLVPDNGTGVLKSKTLAKLWSTQHKELSRLNELTSVLSEKAGVRGPWSNTGDDRVLNLAKWWFESCKSTHKCQSKGLAAKYRPARLMDLDPLHLSGSHWQLVESTNDSPPVPYVTLSHRWGNPEPLKLQAGTRAQLISGMPVDDLAGLYKEVIGVVRRLGMRFLWVDSICMYRLPSQQVPTKLTH